jgi:hypothetical protein
MFVDSHIHKRTYTRILYAYSCFIERVQTIQRATNPTQRSLAHMRITLSRSYARV